MENIFSENIALNNFCLKKFAVTSKSPFHSQKQYLSKQTSSFNEEYQYEQGETRPGSRTTIKLEENTNQNNKNEDQKNNIKQQKQQYQSPIQRASKLELQIMQNNRIHFKIRKVNDKCEEILQTKNGFFSPQCRQSRQPLDYFIEINNRNRIKQDQLNQKIDDKCKFNEQIPLKNGIFFQDSKQIESLNKKKNIDNNTQSFKSIPREQGNSPFNVVKYKLQNIPQTDYNSQWMNIQPKQKEQKITNSRELAPFNSPYFTQIQSMSKQENYEVDKAHQFLHYKKLQDINFNHSPPRFDKNWRVTQHWINYPNKQFEKQKKKANKEQFTNLDIDLEIKEIEHQIMAPDDPRDILDDFYPFINRGTQDIYDEMFKEHNNQRSEQNRKRNMAKRERGVFNLKVNYNN